MNELNIYTKFATLSEEHKKEADNYVDFLLSKQKSKESTKPKKAGLAKGLIKMKEGFDDPLNDFKEYMTP